MKKIRNRIERPRPPAVDEIFDNDNKAAKYSERKRMFCGFVIIIKNFNFINSRRPSPPNLISHLFHPSFFQFTPGMFWLRFHFFFQKIVLVKYIKAKCSQLDRIHPIVASYILLQFKGNLMQITATQMIVHHTISVTPV